MNRLTEYHNGVAVIKNKDFKAAANKLANFEDLQEVYFQINRLQSIGISMLTKEHRRVGEEILNIVDFWAEHEKLNSLKGGGSDE